MFVVFDEQGKKNGGTKRQSVIIKDDVSGTMTTVGECDQHLVLNDEAVDITNKDSGIQNYYRW